MSKCVDWGSVSPVSQSWGSLRVCPIQYDDGSKVFYVNGKKVKVARFANMASTLTFYDNSKTLKVSVFKVPLSDKTFFGNGKKLRVRRLR